MQQVESAVALRKAGAGSKTEVAADRTAKTGAALETEELLRRLKVERKAVADALGKVGRIRVQRCKGPPAIPLCKAKLGSDALPQAT